MELFVILHERLGPIERGELVVKFPVGEAASLVAVDGLGGKLGHRKIVCAARTNVFYGLFNVLEAEVVQAVTRKHQFASR